MLRITCHIYSYMSHITERKKGVFPNLDVQFGLKPKLNLQVPVYKIVRKIALIRNLTSIPDGLFFFFFNMKDRFKIS